LGIENLFMSDSTNHLEAINTIKKKLVGKKLSYKEIYTLMDEIAHERLSDVLTAYFVAAGFKEGFSAEELYFLTKALVNTGTKLHFDGIVADKHSIGGIAGTRATMIVVPIIAAAGYKIPKTSSRAITTPAGTADVMEILAPVTFSPEHITKMVNDVGGCIVWGGHLGIAPADDVIIKVEEPLAFESFDKIIVSVMAKKIAVGGNHLILDIPLGKTMKVKYKKDAQIIAKKFQEIGKRFGMNIIADVNETIEPAGNGIGPFLEAKDVLYVLEQDSKKPLQLEERALRLAGKLLNSCYQTEGNKKDGYKEAKNILESGQALKKFKEIIKAQGGNEKVTSHSLVSTAKILEIRAQSSGTIKEINNFNLNSIARILGAPKDKYAGMYLFKKTGDTVKAHEQLITFYSSNQYRLKEAIHTLQNFPIYTIS
jgi:putative thymidine phosphorylase